MSDGLKKLTVLGGDDSAVCGPDGCLLPVNVTVTADSADTQSLSGAPVQVEETDAEDAGTA